ncbi:MAG: FkbM family methyltransferase [Actinobacteria bacterium]|nr:FkbM family methyltransferase [Actinomycetota bacterium]
MQLKLVILSALERLAALARRLRLGFLVDALAPHLSRPFERFALDVGGVRLHGTDLAQLHYVRELAEQGRERTFVELLANDIPRGGVVLEGGAHLGFITVHAARAVGPEGRVIAFEPNGSVHNVLRANLEENGVAERVDIVPFALGERTGKARFYASGDTSSLFGPSSAAATVEVDVVRGDEAVSGPVDLVKLDVEGAEVAALRGMEGLLANGGPRALFVECHPKLLDQAGSSRDELLAWLRGAGYEVAWIDEPSRRLAPLSEPWSGDYVNLRCLRPT